MHYDWLNGLRGFSGRVASGGITAMSGHRSFKILRDEIDANPVRRARLEEFKRSYDTVIGLATLRPVRGRARKQVAESFGVSPNKVSQLDGQGDICLSALAKD